MQRWNTSRGEWPGPFTSCDVILRSSEKVARTSFLFEIWKGEVVYKDVPVEVEGVGTQPGVDASPP